MSSTLDQWYVSGPFGIGTLSPQAKLHVAGGTWDPSNSEGDLKVGDATYRLKVGVATGGGGAGDVRIRAHGGTNRLMIGSGTLDTLFVVGDRIGIGTVPTHAFHVRTGDAVGLFESTGTQAYLRISANDGMDNRVEVTNRGGGRLSLWTAGGGDALNVTRNGNVGIGTTAPGAKLDVNGDIRIPGGRSFYSYGRMHIHGEENLYLLNKGGTIVSKAWGGNGNLTVEGRIGVAGGAVIGGVTIGGDAPGVNYPYEYETVGVSNPNMNLRLQSPNSIILHLRDGATIDTTPHFASILRCADFNIGHPGRRGSPGRAIVDEGWRLVINYAKDWPNVRVEGNFTHGSSRVHKENISVLSADSASAILRGLNPVQFRFKNDPTGRTCLGFVAEDVPDAVGSGDGTGISPAGLLAILVKTVQEQASAIDRLAARLDRLEGGA